jgi:hypothetical protein
MSSDEQPIDYKTHILIGVRPNGIMTAIADWPYVPRQAEVQEEIDVTRENYVTFVLATPTSIMPETIALLQKRIGNHHARLVAGEYVRLVKVEPGNGGGPAL